MRNLDFASFFLSTLGFQNCEPMVLFLVNLEPMFSVCSKNTHHVLYRPIISLSGTATLPIHHIIPHLSGENAACSPSPLLFLTKPGFLTHKSWYTFTSFSQVLTRIEPRTWQNCISRLTMRANIAIVLNIFLCFPFQGLWKTFFVF